jgi:hypothetical protein
LRACTFAKGEGRAFVAIDRRPFDLADRIACGVVVPDQVLIERRQRRKATADRRCCSVLGLAHVALPGDHRLVVGLAQLRRRRDRERAHEVLHVEPIGAPRARALLLLEPDFFFGDRGEVVQCRDLAAIGVDRHRQVGGVVGHGRPPCFFFVPDSPYVKCNVINRIIT